MKSKPKPSKPVLVPLVARVLSVAIIALAVMASLWYWNATRRRAETDDAYVTANTAGIVPRVAGTITKLYVRESQFVRAGDPLFDIDPDEYEQILAQAQATLSALDEQIRVADVHAEELRAGASAAHAQQRLAEATLAQARDTLARLEPLLDKGFVTAEAVDQARTAVQAAEATLEGARQVAARADLAVSESGVLRAQRPGAVAAVELARLKLSYCHVVAPFDGRVLSLRISEGAHASLGIELFTLLDTRTWYVVADFREGELRHLREGARVDVRLLAYPDRRYTGTIEGVGWGVHPDDGLVLAGVPIVRRELKWVHIAQRFPVRVRIDNPDSDAFRMGASAFVRLADPGAEE